MNDRFASDPREDLPIKTAWDAMSERLREAVRGLIAPPETRDALRAVIDLHVAWERREQVFTETGYSHDVVRGIGCRMCDHRPSLKVVGEKVWCSTLEALRVALIEKSTNLHVIPANQADQAAAWHRGYQAAVTNLSSSSGIESMLTCPFVAPEAGGEAG